MLTFCWSNLGRFSNVSADTKGRKIQIEICYTKPRDTLSVYIIFLFCMIDFISRWSSEKLFLRVEFLLQILKGRN
jgi:hypothetical protein